MGIIVNLSYALGMSGGDSDADSVALLTKYGLGNKRTLDQLIEFTGLDLRNRIAFKDRYGHILILYGINSPDYSFSAVFHLISCPIKRTHVR